MSEAAETPLWLVRPSNSGDTNGIVYLWLESFWRSRYGREFRCTSEKCGRCHGTSAQNVYSPYSKHAGGCSQKPVYWGLHEPRVHRILQRSTVRVACDAESPAVIWGFACIEGDAAVHYVMVKRRFHAEGIGADIFRDLLGDMLERPCVMTHELPDLRREDVKRAGLSVPASWRLDQYAVSDRMEAA